MPYITRERRAEIKSGTSPNNAGELNYTITLLIFYWAKGVLTGEELEKLVYEECLRYWNTNEQRYHTINDILGALQGAAYEYQRRTGNAVFYHTTYAARKFYENIALSYEDKAIERNGDLDEYKGYEK